MAIKVSNSRKKAVFSEINITPLTDIFLVLLIIMMVVAPMFQSNVEGITVPEINSGLTVEEKAATVSITKEGQYYLNGEIIELDNLTKALSELKPTLKKPEVLVKADTAAKSKDILQVMRAAKDAEYEKLTVAGEPLSRKEQKELKKKSDSKTDNQKIVPVSSKAEDNYNRPFAEKPAVQTSRQSDFANTDWEE